MDEAHVKEKVRKVFLEVFGMGENGFHFGMTSEHIRDWDSLSHMNLVSGLEKEFNVSLDIDEISDMDSVQKAVDIIKKKLEAKG